MESQVPQNPVPVQHPQPVPAVHHQANVDVKVARDRAQYVRQQKGHSWLVWWLLLGPITLWIPAVYYSFSPNHYWHL
ncbi:hypothetical protein IXEL_60 [Microbacterium phage Ixel]|nr:hypothetical protein IXEL_60 [Microbacterium phage Ixel]